ncbi:MAG: chemotaxis protein CheX [Lachnospiraceae bacterium]|nr:chemotaxis protein CheX [Lachnospiraceae bacterium]
MLNRLFGNYLVSMKKLTQIQLDTVLSELDGVTARLEMITVVRKKLTLQQLEELDALHLSEAEFEKRVVGAGLLTEDSYEKLMTYQSNRFIVMVQCLVDKGLLELSQICDLMDEFRVANDYTEVQMDAFLHEDIEQMVQIFVPCEDIRMKELFNTMIQTFKRLIDKDVYLEQAYITDCFAAEKCAVQEMTGSLHFKLYLTAGGNDLLAVANYFTKAHYSVVDEDALDNVGEFLNCISGLYATNLSYNDISIDMNIPEYHAEPVTIQSDKIYVIPIRANGCRLYAIYEACR